ncbi:MAG TPA: winged helix-turn-helix domain-containing protein [Stackebrandtia sp.]|jgi:DNA-binding transcriptional ArsR family regulator|uniref:ArsR/SmtB family transcription factor n=1 Tax=Stackebrandtia sp. TaxID=2023065 RepID=UPI002D512F64|nr:winged helix-turn-helix domain-containing protein [Stackebrandtia sp.]HZE40476.1 winged helix-turn-helix domain-containing protein [Stackebrandtia sp.]
MLDIQLSSADYARVSFAAVPHLEIGASVQALRAPTGHGPIDRWRRRVLPRLPPDSRPLLDLVAAGAPIPPILTGAHPLREPDAPADLVRACGSYRRVCAPGAIAAPVVWRELARVGRLVMSQGLGAALSDLSPDIRLDGDVLRVTGLCSGSLRLDGASLLVIPTVFWTRAGFRRAGLARPALVYPVDPARLGLDTAADSLPRLLGRTRAQVLRAVATGPTTSALASMLDISPASASEHVGVLREAGLVATNRTGRSVRHGLTPLGESLVARPG